MTPTEARTAAAAIAATVLRDTLMLYPDELPSFEKADEAAVRAGLVDVAVELYQRAGVRACHKCACTENDPCEEGCAWVLGATPDLCTACNAEASRIIVVSG